MCMSTMKSRKSVGVLCLEMGGRLQMDNEIFEPLNQFDDDLKDLMIDCITEKAPPCLSRQIGSAAASARSAASCPWTRPSTRTAGFLLV